VKEQEASQGGFTLFTGVIQHLGRVRTTRRSAEGLSLSVDAGPLAADASMGDSICVNGVCLTVTRMEGQLLSFDVVGETLSLSALAELHDDDPVNLEPSIRPADRIGGHFVTGHVDGVGTVSLRTQSAGDVRMVFQADPMLARMMIPKGSVAVDGVSLTLTRVTEGGEFAVALIPHTLAVTTLGMRRPGDRVNVETDLIGKWVARVLGKADGRVTEDFLREHGFA
jgi:riboflavin synthase